MYVPLYRDILLQKNQLKALLAKLAAFLLIFGTFDRLAAGFLLVGVERNYGLDVPAEVLCVGHSHTGLGIDKTALERNLAVPVAKCARNGANVADRLVMIKQYLDRQPSTVKVLVYDVDAHTFTGQGLSLNSYSLFYPFMDSPSVDEYIRQQASSVDYSVRHALKLWRFNLESCNDAFRGWLGLRSNLKRGTVDVERLKKEIASNQIRHISFDEDCIKCFDETLQYVVKKGISVVLLYIPTIDLYNEAEPEKHQHAIDMFREFSAKYDRVTFLDYCPAFAHRHELFYDPIHLNPQGRWLVTERLAKDLKRILIGKSDNAS
jgi:hypothetical protein